MSTSSSLRRRLASLVLLAGALALGNYLCARRDGVVPVELRYRLGTAPAARSIEVEVVPRDGGAPIARFATELVNPEVVHRTRLPPGMYTLRITLVAKDGATKQVTRAVEVVRDAVIDVDLSRELG